MLSIETTRFQSKNFNYLYQQLLVANGSISEFNLWIRMLHKHQRLIPILI